MEANPNMMNPNMMNMIVHRELDSDCELDSDDSYYDDGAFDSA